jgi:hypothetical protein
MNGNLAKEFAFKSCHPNVVVVLCFMSAVELSARVCNKTAVASNRKPKLERFYP